MFFTDEMPKNCWRCPCADSEYGVCNIDQGYSIALHPDDRPKECPLQEVKHGRWNDGESLWDGINVYEVCRCSNCMIPNYRETPYCPNCGAKMDGKYIGVKKYDE